jgi:hypothetical protein
LARSAQRSHRQCVEPFRGHPLTTPLTTSISILLDSEQGRHQCRQNRSRGGFQRETDLATSFVRGHVTASGVQLVELADPEGPLLKQLAPRGVDDGGRWWVGRYGSSMNGPAAG